MTRWAMVIDLNKCIGCYACQLACKQEHFLPPDVFWNRVLISETGKYPAVRKQTYPVLCNHCDEAPCVDVCPTGASSKREDGIVIVDYRVSGKGSNRDRTVARHRPVSLPVRPRPGTSGTLMSRVVISPLSSVKRRPFNFTLNLAPTPRSIM